MTATPRRATLEVAGMTCTDCEHHVTAALEQAGAEQVSADFRRGVARFTWPESAGEAALRAAVARAGYTPGRLRAESPGAAAARAGDADYDLLVLGAGSAAFAAAIRGRDAGYRVALAEAGTLGGTCVNVGCVPSKALLAAGAAYWAAGHPRFAGITTSAGPVDLAALVAQKDDLVDALRQEKYAGLVDAYGFEVLRGYAAFTGPDTVEVAGRVIRPGAVLIAAGASPAAPPIPGLSGAGYLTSNHRPGPQGRPGPPGGHRRQRGRPGTRPVLRPLGLGGHLPGGGRPDRPVRGTGSISGPDRGTARPGSHHPRPRPGPGGGTRRRRAPRPRQRGRHRDRDRRRRDPRRHRASAQHRRAGPGRCRGGHRHPRRGRDR